MEHFITVERGEGLCSTLYQDNTALLELAARVRRCVVCNLADSVGEPSINSNCVNLFGRQLSIRICEEGIGTGLRGGQQRD